MGDLVMKWQDWAILAAVAISAGVLVFQAAVAVFGDPVGGV